MLRQVISRLRNASRKVNNRTVARAAFRRRLFVESLEDRRLLAIVLECESLSFGPYIEDGMTATPNWTDNAGATVQSGGHFHTGFGTSGNYMLSHSDCCSNWYEFDMGGAPDVAG